MRNRQHQRHRIKVGCAKSVPEIKPPRIPGQGMRQQATYANLGGDRQSTQHGVAQQRDSQTPALIRRIDGQTGQNNDGNGIRHIPSDGARRQQTFHTAGSERIKPHHTRVITNDEGAARAGFLILQRTFVQPLVEHRFTASKCGNRMSLGQRLRSGYLSQGADSANRARSLGFSTSGSSRAA